MVDSNKTKKLILPAVWLHEDNVRFLHL